MHNLLDMAFEYPYPLRASRNAKFRLCSPNGTRALPNGRPAHPFALAPADASRPVAGCLGPPPSGCENKLEPQ